MLLCTFIHHLLLLGLHLSPPGAPCKFSLSLVPIPTLSLVACFIGLHFPPSPKQLWS